MAKRLILYVSWIIATFLMSGCSFTLVEQTSTRSVPYTTGSCGGYYGYYPSGGCNNSCNPCDCYISDW